MTRPRSKYRDLLVDSAMNVFWEHGYSATTVGDLVSATGVNRGGIYSDFGGKDELFLASLQAYRERFARPAIALLLAAGEAEGEGGGEEGGLAAIEAYFDHFIAMHTQHGMPGPGCFFANVMVELAPHQSHVRTVVIDYFQELCDGFTVALSAEIGKKTSEGIEITPFELESLAEFLATASQGLWSRARSLTDVGDLIRFKDALLALLSVRLGAYADAP